MGLKALDLDGTSFAFMMKNDENDEDIDEELINLVQHSFVWHEHHPKEILNMVFLHDISYLYESQVPV